jgi:outer membrane biogenesis lipoprotein LolB
VSIGASFEGVNDMKRRQFVLVLAGTALLPACTADAAESVVVYKDAS